MKRTFRQKAEKQFNQLRTNVDKRVAKLEKSAAKVGRKLVTKAAGKVEQVAGKIRESLTK